MSIYRADSQTAIEQGQWICKESLLTDEFCGRPRRVVKASGARIYYAAKDGQDDGEYCARKSVVFVCDTQQEAEAVHALSVAQREELSRMRKMTIAKYKARVDELATVPA